MKMGRANSTTAMHALLLVCFIGTIANVNVDAFSAPVSPKHGGEPSAFTIRVCENKHCAKQQKQASSSAGEGNLKNSRPLAQVLQDLTNTNSPIGDGEGQIMVEQSGCLSQCGKGPNISIVAGQHNNNNNNEEQESLCHGIDNPMAAALALKENIADYEVPKILLAACTVMAQAVQEPSPSKRETLMNSVIGALEKQQLSQSSAMASALCLRAEARTLLEPSLLAESIQDASLSVDIRPKSNAKAWHLLHEGLEQQEDYENAVKTLRRWSKVDPAFATKAKAEIERIRETY